MVARPLEWLLCHPAMAANDARRHAEYDRIDAISAQRRSEWERRYAKLESQLQKLPEAERDWKEYHGRRSIEHSRWMRERNEEHRWRSEAHERWYEESRRLSRKADRNLLWFIWGVAVATCIEWTAIAVWA